MLNIDETSTLAQRRDAMRDRLIGALGGLATGDALGTTLEFHAPGSFDLDLMTLAVSKRQGVGFVTFRHRNRERRCRIDPAA